MPAMPAPGALVPSAHLIAIAPSDRAASPPATRARLVSAHVRTQHRPRPAPVPRPRRLDETGLRPLNLDPTIARPCPADRARTPCATSVARLRPLQALSRHILARCAHSGIPRSLARRPRASARWLQVARCANGSAPAALPSTLGASCEPFVQRRLPCRAAPTRP